MTMPFIIEEFSIIEWTIFEEHLSLSTEFIILELPDVVISITPHAQSFSYAKAIFELASLIIELDKQQGTQGMIKGYTHQDFSEMLGTYRETVTQTLNEFKADGLIDTGRKQVWLIDYGRLSLIASN